METPISPENEHIENYLDFYCNLPTAPKFAVLIKGNGVLEKLGLLSSIVKS